MGVMLAQVFYGENCLNTGEKGFTSVNKTGSEQVLLECP